MKEIVISGNTANGQVTLQTELIKGKVECILYECEAHVELLIESELGYTIYNPKDAYSVQYIPIRVRPRDNKDHGWNYDSAYYHLNEKLNISVFGPKNKQFVIKIRVI